MKRLSKWIACCIIMLTSSGWGFFAHQKINRLAVFILPPDMIRFYKKNIQYITEAAVNPDRRRYAVSDEAPRHYIDLDHYEHSLRNSKFTMQNPKLILDSLPKRWNEATKEFGEDSLVAHGIVVWHITRMYFQLKNSFLIRDPKNILRLSAELGHYVSDAHVPLHTTSNYDGQKTDQNGIHAFWESRLPELFSSEYDFFVGKAELIKDVQGAAWNAVKESHYALDSVLDFERAIFKKDGDHKFNFETKGKATIKAVSPEYSRRYHEKLAGMVERRMRASIKMTGDLWYTAWVEAGQPDLKSLINYTPTEKELNERREELKLWKEKEMKDEGNF